MIGRPPEGLDYRRITVRLSEQEHNALERYMKKNGMGSISDAVRSILRSANLREGE
jgi:Arc/MetJ-type ribon-helix-helix transcriptional regulator